MELRKLIILSLLIAPPLWAETASDYVHRGAQEYIFGHDDKAEAAVVTGLQKFPNDPELNNMTTLFRKKPSQKNQQSKDQKNQQQQQQDQQQQQNQQSQSQDQSSANQNQNSQQNQSNQQMAKNEPQKNQQSKPGESPSPSPGNDQSKNAADKNGKQEQPEQSPTPGGGEDQMPSPSPGEGQGEGQEATPSAAPTGSPEKKFAGEIKGANQDKQSQPQENADAFAQIEPEKEGQMSEKQAELLLRSMKDEEARVQLDERKVRRRVYNDW